MTNQQIRLAKRPSGMLADDDFTLTEEAIPALADGQFLIQNEFVSLDPAMRGWMNEGTTYIRGVELGAVMRAFAVGKVVQSNHPDFAVGQYVSGLTGVQTYAVSNGAGIEKIDTTDVPPSWYLGVLGMPGMTAYFGLLSKGALQDGETVFVSGAAGMIGTLVGQIAKIKGCRVVGSAGSAEKCAYLVNEIGFDAAINYSTESLPDALKTHCPTGIDVFFDNVGGPTLDAGLGNLARGARVVICGAISQYNTQDMYGPKNYMKIVSARGIMTGIIVFDFLAEYPKAVGQLSEWLREGKIKYREHVETGIERFPQVLRMLYKGENFGKLVLNINAPLQGLGVNQS
jgi:NADPH-dependent curcumin reductase